jgi:peptidoglycan L-alanyl-D-glutamate endopeptidase CwlK
MYRLGRRSLENLKGVNPILIEILERALEISSNRKDGVDFTIVNTAGVRTPEQQNRLFMDGVSNADGYKKISYHQTGNALDVVPYVNGGASWDETELLKVAVCMLQASKELGYTLQWGGFWRTFKDLPHYQIKD